MNVNLFWTGTWSVSYMDLRTNPKVKSNRYSNRGESRKHVLT